MMPMIHEGHLPEPAAIIGEEAMVALINAGYQVVRQQLTELEVVGFLRGACREAGSQSAFAATHGLSRQHINDVERGRKPPSPAIVAALGLRTLAPRYIQSRPAKSGAGVNAP